MIGFSHPQTKQKHPGGVNPALAETRKSLRHELAVAPKVAAIVNLLL